MFKRKYYIESDDEENFICWKLKNLKKKIKLSKRDKKSQEGCRAEPSDDTIDTEGSRASSPQASQALQSNQADRVDRSVQTSSRENATSVEQCVETDRSNQNTSKQVAPNYTFEDLDPEILDILGPAPEVPVKYSEYIHEALAHRIQHIATTGMASDMRKDLKERYLVPANGVLLGAPLLNFEIKVASTVTELKEDTEIEDRQKQLSAAISALAQLLSKDMKDNNRDIGRFRQLMDVCRILCDVQHAESVARRKLILSSIRPELRCLEETNIERYLFSDELSVFLDSLKAVA